MILSSIKGSQGNISPAGKKVDSSEVRSEPRTAVVPEIAKKLLDMNVQCWLERGIGAGANFTDEQYPKEVKWVEVDEILARSDVLVFINLPDVSKLKKCNPGMILVGFVQFEAYNQEVMAVIKERRLRVFAIELLPRISKAQHMDALSSQASCIGYAAVFTAINNFKRYLPMLTTPAGTIRPATVIVIGVGVAGLQAIATAKRLGARVLGYDVRPEVKEQVESLGAKFISAGIEAGGSGGYARELNNQEKAQQQQALTKEIENADIVITSAGLPGRKPPVVLTEEMVEKMQHGSVVVDTLNGNCALSKADETIVHNGVTIIGDGRLTSAIAESASVLYSKNIFNYVKPWFKTKDQESKIEIDMEEEIYNKCLVGLENKNG